jgi:hypothetical protein
MRDAFTAEGKVAEDAGNRGIISLRFFAPKRIPGGRLTSQQVLVLRNENLTIVEKRTLLHGL